ncbi:thiolase C-terminal domain-containing protein [Streptomyces gilvus]|uniref:thiolase C-terminal domain-containing protein n=1 Tax=Streptomyces gilvus TaxID=2920937 RepID=UPI001F10B5B7|nr:lipid-transfer protein [Streptomyces sp. CME 23]MCH5675652.1 lipid-transfer protein [Streptomyces sp. CME 23]
MSRTHAGLKDRTAIVGIGATDFARSAPGSEHELAAEAVLKALRDAGLDPSEVDGLCSYSMEGVGEDELARTLGMGDIGWFARTPAGGGGACATVGLAATAIATGQADVVVAWRSRKRGARASRPWAQTPERVGGLDAFVKPAGLIRPVDEIAMTARRYMHETGATREHLADIAITIRRHAQLNPKALMSDRTLTREDYFAARMVSDPLCLYDNCLETDGAAAVVLVSAERAVDLPRPPVFVHAAAQGISDGSLMMRPFLAEDALRTPAQVCADRLWGRADIRPGDVDVAQIYDAFTPLVLFSLEAYGFCKPGEAAALTPNGGLGLGGTLPVNTSGGSLSEAYLHGYNLILEAVRQVRGTSTAQVEGAQWSFVCSSDAVPTSALLLRGGTR